VVLRWCSHRAGAAVDPEDAASEVFELVLTRLHQLREPAAFPSWLHWQTRAVLSRHRRRAWVRRWVPDAVLEAVDPAVGPVRRAELTQTARLVERALERLPERQREVLILVDLEEYSLEEAAALAGVPVGTVKSRLSRGRERFRKIAERMKLNPTPAEEPDGALSART
jgi:RNA polymerase sigma-70 factor (ECF subfamily)